MPQGAGTTMPPLPRFGDRPHILHSSSKQTTLGVVTHKKSMNQSVLERHRAGGHRGGRSGQPYSGAQTQRQQ